MFWFLWTIRWDTDYHMMNTVEYTCSDTYVHMWKYDWPFKVKGKLHWLFCSATVVVAEMLAERELSGPVYHWNGFGQWGKGLGHSKCDIMLLYILNEIGARFVKLKNYKYHYISAKQKIMWKIFSFFTCIKRISYFILKYTLYIIVSFKFMLNLS